MSDTLLKVTLTQPCGDQNPLTDSPDEFVLSMCVMLTQIMMFTVLEEGMDISDIKQRYLNAAGCI